MKTFEDYLEEICFRINPSILDDDCPDFFDNWLGELDGADYLMWAEHFGKEMYTAGALKAIKEAQEVALEAQRITQHTD